MDTKKIVLSVIIIVVAIGLIAAVFWSPLLPGDTEDSIPPEDEVTPPDDEVTPPEEDGTTEPELDLEEFLINVEVDNMYFTLTTTQEMQVDEEGTVELVEMTDEIMIRGIDDFAIDYRAESSMTENWMCVIYNSEEGMLYEGYLDPTTGEEEWWSMAMRAEEDSNFLQTVAHYGGWAEEYGIGEHDITYELEGVESATIEFHQIDGELPEEKFLPPEDADPQPY
ncbi:MAG: hypothetical protein ACOC6H_04430 [Thermoproteota archaeon]